MTDATRYPLSWPLGWPRKPAGQRKRAKFTKGEWKTYSSGTGSYMDKSALTVPQGLGRLHLELERLGAREIIVSTNVELNTSGDPRGGRRDPDDPGAAVYFKLNKKDRVLACDSWDRTADNLAAVAAHIDAIRRIDRYGVGTLDQAFAGYDALPPPSADNRPPWRGVLGIKPETPVTREIVSVFYRSACKRAGNDQGALLQLNLARDAALQEIG